MPYFVLFILLFLPLESRAHAVAYEGSTGLMGSFSKDVSEFEVNYSFKHWWSLSAQMLRLSHGTDRPDILMARTNFLLKRWNAEAFQANLYAQSGIGLSRLKEDKMALSQSFTFDIEDRKLYFLSQASAIRAGSETQYWQWKARAGIAPYVAPFESLHTWVILETEKMKGDKFRVSPFLRFFYQNVLWEVGSSLKGEAKLNFIIHM